MSRLACALFCVCGCTSKAPVPLPDRIVIGATLPFSAEPYTARFYFEGYALAIEQAGSVVVSGKRRLLALETFDDGDDASGAVEQVRALVEARRASFLLGSASEQVVEAQSAVAEERKIPYVTGFGASKALFGRGLHYFFGLQPPVQLVADAEMRFVDERVRPPVRVAVLVEDSSRGHEFAAAVRDFAAKSPARHRIVFDESFPAVADQDFSAPLQRMRAARADVLLADATLSEFLTLHRRYLWLGLCHKVLAWGPHGGETPALEEFGFAGLSHLVSAVWWSARLARSGPSRQFVAAFKETYHRDPDWYSALAYESARALVAAIAASGDGRPESVRTQLAAMRMDSILPGGKLAFGPDQQAVSPVVVQQNQPDGSYPIVFPDDLAETAGAVNRCP